MKVIFEDRRLEGIRGKVEAGERLSFEDGVALYRSSDLLALGFPAVEIDPRGYRSGRLNEGVAPVGVDAGVQLTVLSA